MKTFAPRSMTGLEERVLRMLKRECLGTDHSRVAIALSGGADSVALTSLMRDLAPVAGFTVAGVVHLNHQLREVATDDERFCRELATSWSLPIEVGHADVKERSRCDRISIEEAGHRARYEFFDRARVALGADWVATAHTRHDQAETFLMRLVRGAGPAGLSGIHPRSGYVIRPLLDVPRGELRTYLAQRGQTFREDESNADVEVTRNRIRHELIPLLEARFSPSVVDVLARDAAIARHDAEWLEVAANAAASNIVTYEEGGAASLGRRDLANQPVALARRVAKQVLESVAGTTVGLSHVDRFLELARDDRTKFDVDFPGCRVIRVEDRIVIGPPRARQAEPVPDYAYELRIPGEVDVPEAGMVLTAERSGPAALPKGLTADSRSVYVSASRLAEPLIVRSWRPGDWLKPMGLGGRKKVQDVFVDRKVPRLARQTVPIVADAGSGIIWVVGHALSEDARVTPGAEGMLILRARKLGGVG